ncbi:hypothetical protein LPB19_10330 [Marinobacter salinisoli]|uniref:Phosphodiesterase n=1 Tax=Marinobacter salinisoli TaxID=2769486 RepID=A0ABX7MR79_9GAMM|nr:hypothetical protein [Marinobacter salinisoli]QSP93611.1 hypothetical protein LPB19_10330 [Marinobacter salinisoli]
MKKNKILLSSLALAAALTLAPAGSAVAEQVTVPVGTQADRSGISTPSTGMTQASVRAQWGSPLQIQGPVGEPPISQWHYQNFVVYFEHDRVLHSVLKPNR